LAAFFCPAIADSTGLSFIREAMLMKGTSRVDIKPGSHVKAVQKLDQRSVKLTEGVALSILTNSPTHPHGVKVRLTNGFVGRVKEILPDSLDPVCLSIPKI
jgi:uncharacterized repeat protein (TIGR03833 family)